MKRRKFWRIFALTLALGAVCLGTACKKSETEQSSSDSQSSIEISLELNKTAVTLDLLERITLVPIVENLTGEYFWHSSNVEVATVTNAGEVEALAEGVATISVICGDYQAECVVTVAASGIRPKLKVEGAQNGLQILKGNTFSLQSSLSYNDVVLATGVNFEYFVEGTAVSVSSDGVITALSAGMAQVTVKAKWTNFEEYAIVNVSVVKDSALLCDQAKISVSSLDAKGKKLNFTAKVDGVPVANPQVSYEYDSNLLHIDENGYVTNKANDDDSTVIVAKYVVDGTEVLSTMVKVELVFAKQDKTETFNSYRLVGNRDMQASLFEDCFENDGSTVTKIVDLADPSTNLMGSNGKLQLDEKFYGEREWLVYGSNRYACKVKGVQITAEIATADEFKQAFLGDEWASYSPTSNPTESAWKGYYVLTANIDLGGYTGASKYRAYNDGKYHSPVKNAGFEGVIDGQGYSVSNFSLYGNLSSMFGSIGINGTVKNIALIANAGWNRVAGILAFSVHGTLENVFVAGDFSEREIDTMYFGGIAYTASGATFKNVVSYITGIKVNQKAYSFVAHYPAPSQYTNCYAVNGNNVNALQEVNGLKSYSFYEYDLVSYDYDGYDTAMWDTSAKLPVFKNAKSQWEQFKDSETGSLETKAINASNIALFSNVGNKKVIQLVDENGNMLTNATFTSSDDSILVVNEKGIVSALKPGEATITVTLASNTQKNVKIKAYEYIEISTREQFMNAFTTVHYGLGQGVTSVAKDTYYGAYKWYALTADIDFGRYAVSSKYPAYANSNFTAPTEKAGFYGVFDGQGHTIYNFDYAWTEETYQSYADASLFGTIGKEGVVKNVAFIPCNYGVHEGSIVAFTVYGTLENVFVGLDYSDITMTTGRFGALAYATDGATIKNCVTYVGGYPKTYHYANPFINKMTNTSVINSYCVYGDNVGVPTSTNGLTAYAYDEYRTQTYDYTGYDDSIWNLDGSLPVFKSVLSLWKIQISQTSVSANELITVGISYHNRNYIDMEASAGTLTLTEDPNAKSRMYSFIADSTLYGKKITLKLYLFGNLAETYEFEIELGDITIELNEDDKDLFVNKVGNDTWQIKDKNGDILNGATYSSTDASVATVDSNGLVTAVAPGETVINVINGTDYAALKITVYEYIEISTREQFMNAFTVGNYENPTGISSNPADTYYGAYKWYALTQDIDFGGYAISSKYKSYDSTSRIAVDNAGFSGVLDGQGHVLKNYAMYKNEVSLFGTIGKKGTIKNLGLMPTAFYGQVLGTVALSVFGTIDNVFIAFDLTTNGSFDAKYFGGIAHWMDGATIKNCVVYAGGAPMAGGYSFIPYGNGTVENCYVVNGTNFANYQQRTGLTAYDIDDYQTQTYDYTGFNSAIWKLDGGLPVFKNALDGFTMQTGETNITLSQMVTIAVTDGSRNFVTLNATVGTLTANGDSYSYQANGATVGNQAVVTMYVFGYAVDTLTFTVIENLSATSKSLFSNATQGKTWQITGDSGSTLNGASYQSLDTSIATVDANGLVTAVAPGETKIKVTQGLATIEVSIVVYEYIEITTREQFMDAFTVGNYENPVGISSNPADTYYGAYKWYALTQDIDFGGYAISSKYKSYDSTSRIAVDNAGFSGVLDGQGHVLKNYAMYKNEVSLFGTIGKKGTIKNLGLMPTAFYGQVLGTVALSVFGTIDNVFIAFDLTTNGSFNVRYFGGIAHWMDGATIKNCVVYAGGAPMAGGYSFIPYGNGTVENCYVVNGTNFANYQQRTGLTAYSKAEYATKSYDYTGFDTNYWKLDGGLPVFKNAEPEWTALKNKA